MANPWGGGGVHTNAGRASVRAYVPHKARERDNFIFQSPIYTIFDPVMYTTITLDELEDE